MAISNTYDFYVPEAKKLADLVGMRADLIWAKMFAETFLNTPDAYTDINPAIQRSGLCIAALIIYGRTSGNGIRESLPVELIESLGSPWIETHRSLKDLRDKWAAHSVNNLEESGVTLQAYIDEDQVIHAQSIGERHKNTLSLSGKDMLQLKELCEKLIPLVTTAINVEKASLLRHAKSMDLSVLISNPAAFGIPMQSENISSARKKYGHR